MDQNRKIYHVVSLWKKAIMISLGMAHVLSHYTFFQNKIDIFGKKIVRKPSLQKQKSEDTEG